MCDSDNRSILEIGTNEFLDTTIGLVIFTFHISVRDTLKGIHLTNSSSSLIHDQNLIPPYKRSSKCDDLSLPL